MRLLVLTHTFPPSSISNAKRPYYIVQRLLDEGWQVDVLTSEFGLRPGQTETVIHPSLRVFRLKDTIVQLNNNALEKNRSFRAAALGVSALLWPDTFALWARKVLRHRVWSEPYDRVLTFVLPASLLFSGRRCGLVTSNWTFDFQESVTPYNRLHPRRSPLQRMLTPLLVRLERRTLHKAGHVVFTADTNRRAYIDAGMVPEKATVHIPYFYDAGMFKPPLPKPDSVPGFQIVYFGTFDWRGERNPETFLRALAQFLQNEPDARPHTQFLFHGNWLPEHNHYIDELHLGEVVSLQPTLPYEQYLERLKGSPILLLVVSSAHNLFMPSKIVDYFGATRPILAFVPRNSEMRRVLEQAGMGDFACDEFDAGAGTMALKQLWNSFRSQKLNVASEKTRIWSSETQLPRYLDLVRGI